MRGKGGKHTSCSFVWIQKKRDKHWTGQYGGGGWDPQKRRPTSTFGRGWSVVGLFAFGSAEKTRGNTQVKDGEESTRRIGGDPRKKETNVDFLGDLHLGAKGSNPFFRGRKGEARNLAEINFAHGRAFARGTSL